MPYSIVIGVYSAHVHDNNSVIDATKQSTQTNVSITCHAKHVCLYHKVQVVWLININSSQDTSTKYSTSDSDQLYEEFGVSIHSTCPDYECYSTLTLPTDEDLNNTQVLCGAFTEVCAGELKHPPRSVMVITKQPPLPVPPPPPLPVPPPAPPHPIDPCNDPIDPSNINDGKLVCQVSFFAIPTMLTFIQVLQMSMLKVPLCMYA